MKKFDRLSRRDMLQFGVQVPAVGAAAALLAACDGGDTGPLCGDPNTLSFAENSIRQANNYVEAGSNPAEICETCAFFRPETPEATCGHCDIFEGPVNRLGHCDSWSAKDVQQQS